MTEPEPRSEPRTDLETAWSIRVAKEYHKFSAAHFLIFEDGSAERLHGHNYRVGLELHAADASHGMVLDFRAAKTVLSDVLDRLDERVLLPGEHPVLTCVATDGDAYEVRHGEKRYVLPAEDVVVLPVDNTSSENLADWIARAVLAGLRAARPELPLESVVVTVEETSGQSGSVTLRLPTAATRQVAGVQRAG